MKNKKTILEMKDITVVFPGVKALDNVSFNLREGEVHALLGENGAGKSTLVKTLVGINRMASGDIIYEGQNINFISPGDALNLGISMIHQELMNFPEMTIAENVWVGREPVRGPLKLVDTATMNRNTKEYLHRFGLSYTPQTKMKRLNVAGMQIIEIIRAISYNSRIIIMDEPTSALEGAEVDKLFSIIAELKKAGTAVIYISHKLDEIYRIADRVSIMRDGKMICTENITDLSKEDMITRMVGRNIEQLFPDRGEVKLGAEVLRLEGFCRKHYFNDINLSVREGEILGISGLMGSGRTETMEALFGYTRPDKGDIYISGEKVVVRSPRDAIAKGVALVTEDRKEKGLVACRSVCENITLVHLKRMCKGGVIRHKVEVANALRVKRAFRIKTPTMQTRVSSLSGGNQQKVVLGKWIVHEPKVLILDEPTRGIDVGSKYEIYKHMIDLASKGIAIIMVSSEMPEILGMSDRILVMHDGKVKGEFLRDEASQEKLMAAALF